MTEEELNAWHQFQSRAIAMLNRPTQNFLALSINPSFGKVECLSVSQGKNDFDWIYKCWDKMADQKRIFDSHEGRLMLNFRQHTPDIRITEGKIAIDAYKKSIEITKNLNLRSMVPATWIGVDGTLYSISIGDRYRESSYSWWEQLPKEWANLEPILEELFSNLETARNKIT